MGRQAMIGARVIENIVEDAIISGNLKDERPVSLILVAPPGLGKSELVQQYASSDGVLVSTATTFFSLMTMHGIEMQQGTLHHIIIPDMGPMVNKSPREAAMAELGAFGSLVAEGITNWRSARSSFAIGASPVRCGMIFCITPTSYIEKLTRLGDEGFLSRFITVSYSMKLELQEHISEKIIKGEKASRPENRAIKGFARPQIVTIDEDLSRWLIDRGMVKEVRDESDTAGFRTLQNLLTLLKANALRHGRHAVNREDIRDMIEMREFIGPRMKPLELD